ncbi:MAG: T9SS type A sorting domain-containing protein [Vicingaceae bacterium]
MKNLLLSLSLTLTLSLLLLGQQANASHILGGEITWECDTTGAYIFKLKVYRECTGIPFAFDNSHSLQVFGTPLPLNAQNQAVSSIALLPDSGKWLARNKGQLNPNCNTSSGSPSYTCSNADQIVQEFYFQSAPVNLQGTPSPQGWDLVWTAPCCRPNISNLNVAGTLIVRAKMLPNPNRSTIAPCLDNSPHFQEAPEFLFCRGLDASNVYTTMDADGDSLSYSFDRVYNTPASNPNPIAYAMGYNYNNPTPDQSFHNSNVAASLNTNNGLLKFKVNNGLGFLDYAIVVKVESYRDGRKNAEVIRDLPISIADCPTLANGVANQAPIFNPPFNQGGSPSFKDSILVGNYFSANINVSDTNAFSTGGQEVSLQILSDQIKEGYTFQGNCPTPGDTSCAYVFSGLTPVLDSTTGLYEYKQNSVVGGSLRWAPDCSDLGPNGEPKTYYFALRAADDYCPIPAVSYEVLEVTVLPNPNNPCQQITELEDDQVTLDQLTLFPNPTKGHLRLQLPKSGQITIQVFDIQGKLMQGHAFTNKKQIDFELPERLGVYLLEITNQAGERSFRKVVKQ